MRTASSKTDHFIQKHFGFNKEGVNGLRHTDEDMYRMFETTAKFF